MNKLSIKSKFYLSSAISTLGFSVLVKLMYWLNAYFSTNVNFINTDNIFLKALPQVTNYAYIILAMGFVAVSIGAICYAISHFGPATSYKTALISLGSFVAAEITSYIYGIVYNSFNEAAFKATLISVGIELVYIAILVFITPSIAKAYLRFSLKNKTTLSRLKISTAVIPAVAIYFLIKLGELAIYTVDAMKSYISHGNTFSASVVISIILDVIYYFMLYFAAPVALGMLTIYTLTKITGPLKLKIKGETSKK